jgi:DNA end-binding protein Ku
MFFMSEVRAEDEYRTNTDTVSGKELELAKTLIHSLRGPFEPEKYRDTYREKLEEMIAKKVSGEPAESNERPSRSAIVVDITDALRQSLAALKKSAGKEPSVLREGNNAPRSTARRVARPKATGA